MWMYPVGKVNAWCGIFYSGQGDGRMRPEKHCAFRMDIITISDAPGKCGVELVANMETNGRRL